MQLNILNLSLIAIIGHNFSVVLGKVNLNLNVSSLSAEISNGLFDARISNGTVWSLVIGGRELIGNAVGFYSSVNGNLRFTPHSIRIASETPDMVDVAYGSDWGELHYVVRSNVSGIYSYFVATNIGTVGEFRTLYRVDGDIFRSGYTSERSGVFYSLADINNGTKLQDETWRLADGTVATKYDWATYVADDWCHGVYGDGLGVWMISASHEYINGGPMKQELMVHVESATNDGVVLNMLSASHFGTPEVAIPSGKIYGPWLVYFNDGNSSDAEAVAVVERAAWPYSWLSNAHFPLSRTTVVGSIKLADGRAAAGAMVVLAKAGGDVYPQGTDYIFYSKANALGVFSISHVRSGTYTLYAYADGGSIGDVTDQLVRDNIEVNGASVNVGVINWYPPLYPIRLWQIGSADRKTREFKLGNVARQYGLNYRVPANLTFTVGSSRESSDWYYAQTVVGTWTVLFNANHTAGTAILTVAQAGQTRKVIVEISINGKSIGRLPTYANDMAIYRSANPSGYYHLAVLDFPANDLVVGVNALTFEAIEVEDGGGVMYDTIKMEIA